MQYKRLVEDIIEKQLFRGKVIIVYGARRTGKTTLVKRLIAKSNLASKYINCDHPQNQILLASRNPEVFLDLIGPNHILVFDEAQQVENIGMVLKILVDTYPDVQYIATGSSSFDLSAKIAEPLTGRSREYLLHPLSFKELNQYYDWATLSAKLPIVLRFGLYPDVFNSIGEETIEELNNIASNYLYKDLLQFENIRKPDLVYKILKALGLQIGSECSLNELAKTCSTNVHTIQRYLELLEKSFIIFRLSSYSRNLRKEINKSQKVFFYDIGIRNTIIQNFNPMELRNDVGGLWENFCITERIKFNNNQRRFVNIYFWRTYDQKEIDYIEEKDGQLVCFEFKYNAKTKAKIPQDFVDAYPNSIFKTITPDNFYELLKE